jgi:hypothetical protein
MLLTLHREHYELSLHNVNIVRLVLDNLRSGCVKDIESGNFELNYYPRSISIRIVSACLKMLAYICLNPDVYSQDDLRRLFRLAWKQTSVLSRFVTSYYWSL